MDETDRDAIFRLSETVEEAAPCSGGRGFGLLLVRQAVARIGGELDVESDGGAILTVTLPLASDRRVDDERGNDGT